MEKLMKDLSQLNNIIVKLGIMLASATLLGVTVIYMLSGVWAIVPANSMYEDFRPSNWIAQPQWAILSWVIQWLFNLSLITLGIGFFAASKNLDKN